MSWVTIIWSMNAAACLTLGAIYFLVWCKNRDAWTYLLFSVTAVSTAAFGFGELSTMQATTVGELRSALRLLPIPLFCLTTSVTWFVWTYLGAGRTWLALTISALRLLYLLPALLMRDDASVQEMASLQRIRFLGEWVTVRAGVTNPFQLLGFFGTFLILVFVADAGITAWRRGDRRKALVVGGSIEFFMFTALLTTMLVMWANVQVPIVVSFSYLSLLAVMGYELSRDVLHASQLVAKLQASEWRLQTLTGRLLTAQEEERRRIARELHDNLNQRMALLSIEIENVAMQAVESPATVPRSLRDLGQRAAEISHEIHTMSHGLHSAKLEALGLAAAVRGHCHEVQVLGVRVQFSDSGLPPSLSSDVELCLFRIVQEGLNNIVKHSGASDARVTLTGTGDAVRLRIVDTGRGFDQVAAGPRRGLGLASMGERLRLVDGELTIRSRAGHGTTLDVRVPLVNAHGPAADAVLARVALEH